MKKRMSLTHKEKFKGFVEFAVLLAILVLSAYLVDKNIEFIEGFVSNSPTGVIVYLLIEVVSIVIAPVTTLPLIIVASNVFGWVNAGIYSLAGWIIGSVAAFEIARKYGKRVVKKLMPLEKIEQLGERISRENSYLGLIFLRIVFPMDLLSYFLGLFSTIKLKKFLITTTIGLAPLAFGFSFIGEAPFKEQMIFIFLLALLIAIIWLLSLAWKNLFPHVRKRK